MGFMDGTWLFASLLVSGIGYVLLSYGRKLSRAPQLVVGLVLLVFPYFVSSLVPMLLVTAVLLAAVWVAVRLGW